MSGDKSEYGKLIRAVIVSLILSCHTFWGFGCGNNQAAQESPGKGYGSYSARLTFPPEVPRRDPPATASHSTKAVEPPIDCDESGIAVIRCTLSSADNTIIVEENWQCSRGEGFVGNIPKGTGITVTVEAITENDMVLLRGEEENVTIIADQHTEGNIKLEPAAVPTVKAGSEPKTMVFDWSHIDFPSGTDHYQLQVDPDNSSQFKTITEQGADHIQGTEFPLTVSVHLIDWAKAAYRVVALDAAGNTIGESLEIDLLSAAVSSADVIGYFKAGNAGEGDKFGRSVSLSADGSTMAVGAIGEDSESTGIDQDGSNNEASDAGAVYIFTRSGAAWDQQAYIKAGNADDFDEFGQSVSLSADGSTLAVGAIGEDSDAMGINSAGSNNDDAPNAGAVYLY